MQSISTMMSTAADQSQAPKKQRPNDAMESSMDNIVTFDVGGKIFKRKTMSPSKLTGLGYFGFAGFTYMYFPHMVMHFGQSMTMFGMSAASIMGMIKF